VHDDSDVGRFSRMYRTFGCGRKMLDSTTSPMKMPRATGQLNS